MFNEYIDKLFKCYNKGYEPPLWSKKINKTLMKQCKVFYHNGENLEDIKRLVKEREPVNIEMNRYYDKQTFYKYFGYKTGYYAKCPNSIYTITPPNILVYTPTHLHSHNGKIIHILNAIGLAFDNKRQPDYKNYINYDKTLNLGSLKHINQALFFYKMLFTLIFEAAITLKKTTIVMSLIGANNFAKLWKGGYLKFQTDVWIPAFNEITSIYKRTLKIICMGCINNPAYNLTSLKGKDIGFFPQCISKIKDLDNTLFINAWDCWSIPGNGNNNDNSLDGHIGRTTQIGVNGTSLVNPFLLEDSRYIKI